MYEELRRVETGTRLIISRSARNLQYFGDGLNAKVFPVAVGKKETPTPTGIYKIVNKIINPGNILGTRWMGLSIPGGNYGIHGTNNPSSIGKFISKGCIRMHNHDVEKIFPLINIGTPVLITDIQDNSLPPQNKPNKHMEGRKNHIVKAGETLWKISNIYNVSMELIIRANNISNPDVLKPGQILIIP